MSKMSPKMGMVPTSTPIPRFAAMRASVTYGTPRTHAATGITSDSNPANTSPRPGTSPIIPSRPKRNWVPGMRKASSRRVSSPCSVRSRKIHAPRFQRSAPAALAVAVTFVRFSSWPFIGTSPWLTRSAATPRSMLQSIGYTAAIVQWQNACLWHRMSWVRSPLAAPISLGPTTEHFVCRVSVTPEISQITTIGGSDRSLPGWLTSFEPRRGLSNGHLQTIVGNFLPRPPFLHPSVAEEVEVDPADGSRVLCHSHWQPEPERASRLTLILVHGLEGSSDSRYIQGVSARAWEAGYNVVRMNMRNCGDTDTLTPTLYHSGLSGDLGAVVSHFAGKFGLERVALVGYSMGGNLVLKLAGEWGNRPPLVAVAAVCPAVDLAPGSDALHEPANRIYEYRFLLGLMRRFHRKAALFPGRYQTIGIGPVRSLRDFDDKIVARSVSY